MGLQKLISISTVLAFLVVSSGQLPRTTQNSKWGTAMLLVTDKKMTRDFYSLRPSDNFFEVLSLKTKSEIHPSGLKSAFSQFQYLLQRHARTTITFYYWEILRLYKFYYLMKYAVRRDVKVYRFTAEIYFSQL